MGESKKSAGEGISPTKRKNKKATQSSGGKFNRGSSDIDSNTREVLFKVGGLEYKMPGKRQRVVIASIVLGLNLLLVIAVAVYFYSPSFQEFVYNFGRN